MRKVIRSIAFEYFSLSVNNRKHKVTKALYYFIFIKYLIGNYLISENIEWKLKKEERLRGEYN
jgi:hypothetical protein